MHRILASLTATLGIRAKRKPAVAAIGDEQRAAIDANTQLVIGELSASAGFTLALDHQSVVWIDGFIERSRHIDIDTLHDIIASFYGSAIIAIYGGQWIIESGETAIAIEPDFIMYPFSSVAKHFTAGRDHSVLSLFNGIEPMLASHRAQ
ncbi:MAG: hypothetical protein AAFO81_01825 [Pseudomonadota bacterium]